MRPRLSSSASFPRPDRRGSRIAAPAGRHPGPGTARAVRVREELLIDSGAGDAGTDVADLVIAMGRWPGCLRCVAARDPVAPGSPRYRVESDWSSVESFFAWTGCALFAAVASQLAGRRLWITPLPAAEHA